MAASPEFRKTAATVVNGDHKQPEIVAAPLPDKLRPRQVGGSDSPNYYVPVLDRDYFEFDLRRRINEADKAIALHNSDRSTISRDLDDRPTSLELDDGLNRTIALNTAIRDEAQHALNKITSDDGDFGYCEESGERIPYQRLVANPAARFTVEVQERHERHARLTAGSNNHAGLDY